MKNGKNQSDLVREWYSLSMYKTYVLATTTFDLCTFSTMYLYEVGHIKVFLP